MIEAGTIPVVKLRGTLVPKRPPVRVSCEALERFVRSLSSEAQ